MGQIYKVRLPDGRVVRPTEWSSTPLYSTVEMSGAGQTDLLAFAYGEGGDVPGSIGPRKATLADTNFRGDGGYLQENEELLLFSIMVELFMVPSNTANFFTNNDIGTPDPPEVSLKNVLRFQRDVMLTLRIAETKDYIDHPVGFFPAAMGVQHSTGAARALSAAGVAGSAILGGTHGGIASYDNRRIATPHKVQPGEVFEVAFRFPAGAIGSTISPSDPLAFGTDTNARLRARAYADGYRRRPVA